MPVDDRSQGSPERSPARVGSDPGTHRAAMRFDQAENIVFVWHPVPVHLETREEIATYFEANRKFWRDNCGGKKAYFVIDFDGQSTNVAHQDFYADCIKAAVDECAITVVRYGGEMLQRLASRMAATRLHVSSNVYRSRDEALAVVRGLRDGTTKSSH
jgi:hypothetical protein